jgi:hypothetical protein
LVVAQWALIIFLNAAGPVEKVTSAPAARLLIAVVDPEAGGLAKQRR